MDPLVLTADVYQPTSPRTGAAGRKLLRIKNMLLTGYENQVFLQCYKGSFSLSETIATQDLTGTIAGSLAGTTITGTGTAFKAELRQGQFVFAVSQLLVVNRVISDTSFTIYKPLTVALVTATGKRMPDLFEINRQRGTLTQGNALQLDKGAIIAAGTGTLRLNGSTLAGSSLVLTGNPRIAQYTSSSGNYAPFTLGMATPTGTVVIASVGSGTKNMQAGHYSIRLAPARQATAGYNNPGVKWEFDLATNGDRVEVDVSSQAMDTTNGQDAWDVYVTELTSGGIQGPWWFYGTVTSAMITANKFIIEWLDAEVNRQGLLEFNNDTPPAAGYVALLEGNPIWISCFGLFGGSPGPSLVPATPRNIDGAPTEWHVTSSPPQNLLGAVSSLARLYLPTPNSLLQAVYAPTGDPIIPPISVRPYWPTGFGNPHQVTFVNGMLVGYPHGGPTRSIADAEVADEQFFGDSVAEIIDGWYGAHVLVEADPDPDVNAVCFFHPSDSTNSSGFLTTRVLIWGVGQQDWIGDVTIESTTRDMVVCGVARVDDHLEFLAGGRLGAGIQVDTFRWNTAAAVAVDYYAAWQLTDGGMNDRNKAVRAMRATGKFTSGAMMLYGFDSETDINITNIEAGTSSTSGSLSLGTQTKVQQGRRLRCNFPSLGVFTMRVSGTYGGSGDPDRLDEAYLEYILQGNRR